MTTWLISEGITEITKQYIQDNMPDRTTEIVIPSNVQSIGDQAFKGYTGLKSIEIHEGVTSIVEGAFYGCTSLESIVIPEGIQSIGDGAFYGCTSLESIVIPEGLQSIGHWAFKNCTSLESIVIPEGIQSIGDGALEGCTSLKTIVIPEDVQSIGRCAFLGCVSLKSIAIPEGIQSIRWGAFAGCTNLESIVIPESVQRIDDRAFKGCTSLESVVIPESVKRIGGWAFWGCTRLNLVVLPDALVENILRYGITDDQTVFLYSKFIRDWKRDNGLENKSYSDQTVLFLYQLQNIERFNPSWNEALKKCPEVKIEDLLTYSGSKELHQQLHTVMNIYENTIPIIKVDLIRDKIMSYLTVGDLSSDKTVAENKLTSQSLFSRLRAKSQDLKVLSFTACAVLAMGVGIAYMQRHDGVKYLDFGL